MHNTITQAIALIIQLCFLEYKYRAKRVQITDICTRLIPPGRVKFKTLASQNFEKRDRWIINLLLDVLVCSIAVYFYSLFVFCLFVTFRKLSLNHFTKLMKFVLLANCLYMYSVLVSS